MDLQEIERRLCILNGKEVPTINKRMLRGGMQERLRRQDIRRYGQDIKNQRTDLINKKVEKIKKLDLLKTQEDSDFSIMSVKENTLSVQEDTLSKFNEPKLKRIRNKRSFF